MAIKIATSIEIPQFIKKKGGEEYFIFELIFSMKLVLT